MTKEEGIQLALDQHYEFKESSCVQNKNVAGAFEALVERWNFLIHTDCQFKKTISDNRFNREIETPMSNKNNSFMALTKSDTIVLKKNNHKKKKFFCCNSSK